MKIILPNYIKNCIKTIQNNGYEAFCVGGAIRNSLLGITPDDYDIATSAPAEKILNMFEKTIPTGIKHGTVTVLIDKKSIEVTTYRTESGYNDFRHPTNVDFVNNINEDLKRRDFTINALSYNEDVGLIDLFGGIGDLENKIIRTVGNAEERFNEDALRILRCFRFAASLDFNIEEKTLFYAKKLNYLLKNVSVERIFLEFKKIFLSKNPLIFNEILKEKFFIEFFGKATKISDDILKIDCDFQKRFSYFCYENKIEPLSILSKLKSDNFTKNKIDFFYKVLNLKKYNDIVNFKKNITFIPFNELENAFTFRYFSLSDQKSLNFTKSIIKNSEPYRIDMLKISGGELEDLGYNGIEIKNCLEKLLDICIENPNFNVKDKLIKILNNF